MRVKKIGALGSPSLGLGCGGVRSDHTYWRPGPDESMYQILWLYIQQFFRGMGYVSKIWTLWPHPLRWGRVDPKNSSAVCGISWRTI